MGMKRTGTDVGFMLIAYNLRRIGNILTQDRLKEYLRILVLMFISYMESILEDMSGIFLRNLQISLK